MHVKGGCVKQMEKIETDELKSIKSLGEESTYKFLGVLENSRQEDRLVLENSSKRVLAPISDDLVRSTPRPL